MSSQTPDKQARSCRQFGAVKWFGGRNGKTGKENHFGFIESVEGHDVFLHKKAWRGSPPPEEGDLVTFFEENRDGKSFAEDAAPLHKADMRPPDLYAALGRPALAANAGALGGKLARRIRELFCARLVTASPEEMAALVGHAAAGAGPSLFRLVAGGPNEVQNYERLLKETGLHVLDEEPWSCIEPALMHRFDSEIAQRMPAFDTAGARKRFDACLDVLPAALLTRLLVQGVYTSTRELGRNSIRVYDYLKSVIADQSTVFPDYLQAAFASVLATGSREGLNPVLGDIVENLLFKKSLFDKSTAFMDIYEGSRRLKENLETFILYHLFSLTAAGNSRETVYAVFLQRLWEAITTGALSVEQQHARLMKLFPSCLTQGALSCEAVYWPKEEIFLCRGKQCHRPQVLPEPRRGYAEFTIYDWFAHYGVDYLHSGQPSIKDFPIKLAGYFNRLREILPVLHCSSCNALMLPDMRYARTEYKEIRNGVVELKSMAAAYRLTVFHCNDQHCEQYQRGHYINHCVGFGCYHLIDSRALKQRCSQDRYICKGCGSCCPDHGQMHPAGLCGSCGAALKVYRKAQTGPYVRKFARCVSPSCGFQIGPDSLPARFSKLPAEEEALPDGRRYTRP